MSSINSFKSFITRISLNLVEPSFNPMPTTKSKETIINKALHYFNTEGWNCAESVYMAIFQEYYNIDVTPKTVTAFGGGIAHTGIICGAVNVGIMGISQKYGRETPKQPFIRTQHRTIQFLNHIIDEYGSLNCTRLKEHQQTQQKQQTEEDLCTPLIRKIIEAFLQTVENNKPT
jgi:C_GCAxxG_C_C family probable redox protein